MYSCQITWSSAQPQGIAKMHLFTSSDHLRMSPVLHSYCRFYFEGSKSGGIVQRARICWGA